MRYIYSDINEDTDYISHNYGEILLFISKKDKDCNITINRYSPKFARLRANSSLLFENIYINGMSLYDCLKLTQMNIRISANYLPFSEFHNVYNYQLNIKVNAFIRQIYGGSELYECDASDYDIHDLQFLTTPISNVKWKIKNQYLIDFIP